jgi:hypothetical protein
MPRDFLMLTLGVGARDGGVVLWQVIAAMQAARWSGHASCTCRLTAADAAW